MTEQEQVTLKVAAGSDPKKVGSSVAHHHAEGKRVQIKAIGPGAVNQAVKAVTLSMQWLSPRGVRPAIVPAFFDVHTDDGTISGIILTVVDLNAV